MKLVPAKTPGFIKALFPNFIWSVTTSRKELYLTFDDGPTPEITVWVLDILKRYNAKATFFCIGSNIKKYPDVFEKIISEGHTIGNHTFNHLKGWKHKTKDYLKDVEKTQVLIHTKPQIEATAYSNKQLLSGVDVHQSSSVLDENSKRKKNGDLNLKLFRPPYGKLKPKQAKQLHKKGYNIVLWDVLSFDWDTSVSKEKCFENVLNSAENGSIIVFHDSVKASQNLKYSLPKVLEYYNSRGFIFKALN